MRQLLCSVLGQEGKMAIEIITYDSPVEALEALVRALVSYEQRYQMI